MNKSELKQFKHNGYEWGGRINADTHFFVRPVKKDWQVVGYKEMKVTEEDLLNGNFEYFAENNLTR